MKYHYTYRITNKILKKHYYGVRTSKDKPELDLGIKYFSSSSDSDFIKDQNCNIQNYRYKILKVVVKSMLLDFLPVLRYNSGISKNKNNKMI